MAILCGWPGPCGVEGKGCGTWTDAGVGGMVCVVGMRGRQQGAGRPVCSRSICGLEARAWTEGTSYDGEEGMMESEGAEVRKERTDASRKKW